MNEPTTISLTHKAKNMLSEFKEQGIFDEMLDGFKLAISYALLHGQAYTFTNESKETYVNAGTDTNKEIYNIVKALRTDDSEPVYKTAERLAEWGIRELYHIYKENGNNLPLNDILKKQNV
jgi:hypothetical protein